MEKHTVSRLIGSPPGYVGHEEGGRLTEAVRRKPYSIVLFDEIEKAHPDVLQILLQVLEEGHLTDGLGRRTDFKNTLLIMTSNVGAEEFQRTFGLGFGSSSPNAAFEQVKSAVEHAAKKTFKPEFLNRIGEQVIFRPLTREHMKAIVDLELKTVAERLKTKGITLKVGEDVKQFLIDKGFDEKMGARPLKRAIERYVENRLADDFLEQKIKAGQRVKLKMEDKRSIVLQ
jgi:ATP-dependent Clp protease ATP-binding subunit ClpC